MYFLAARPVEDPTVAIIGAPYDATSSFRRGSRHAPQAIRIASQSIETYSPILQRDLEDVALTDLGDLALEGGPPEAAVMAVRAQVDALADRTFPVLLGGEHTVTLGAIQALHPRYPDLAVLQLDAHTDLREEYEGHRLCHATVMRRVADLIGPRSLVQLGVRAGSREEWTVAHTVARYCSSRLEIPPEIWTWLEDRPLYVTIDIDAIDPSAAPHTGNPEPEGLTASDVLTLARRLGDLRVVGLDLVEVSPPLDPPGRTAVLAAVILREAILSVAPRLALRRGNVLARSVAPDSLEDS